MFWLIDHSIDCGLSIIFKVFYFFLLTSALEVCIFPYLLYIYILLLIKCLKNQKENTMMKISPFKGHPNEVTIAESPIKYLSHHIDKKRISYLVSFEKFENF